jgi:hypothetical protein
MKANHGEYKNNFAIVGNRNKSVLVEHLKKLSRIDEDSNRLYIE